jgi:L-iditol 2-dehydrogenase
VPQRILYRLPDELPFEHAAFVEPLSIAVHAAHRAHVAAHETVVVVGAGMIGLLQIQVLRAYGCSRIIAVDVAPEKLEMARKLGATETINSASSSVVEDILQRTDGRGVDLSFECVGIGATIDIAVRAVRKGGRITLIGNISPSVALPLQAVVTRELTINGSCASCGEYPECLELMAAGAVNVAPLTSAVVPLADGAKWFERLYQKEAGLLKVILTP